MEEILDHLEWLKPYPINNGIILILGGAGFCPSTVFRPFEKKTTPVRGLT